MTALPDLTVEHVHEPGDDTVDRLAEAVRILLAEAPHERRAGEAA